MSEQISQATPQLFQQAQDGDATAQATLTEMLNNAAAQDYLLASTIKSNLVSIVEKMNCKALNETQAALLQAILNNAVEHAVLRSAYAELAKHTFADYKDPAGLTEAIGFRSSTTQVKIALRRWNVFKAIKQDALCYDQQCRQGTILSLDDMANEVSVQFSYAKKNIKLTQFLNSYLVVKIGSTLEAVLNRNMNAMEACASKLENDVVRACALPSNFLRMILVPACMTEKEYLAFQGALPKNAPAKKEAAAAESTPVTTTAAPEETKNTAGLDWKTSRSVLELSERLKTFAASDTKKSSTEKNLLNPNNEDLNLDKIKQIFVDSAAKPEQATNFALCIALLQKMGDDKIREWLGKVAEELAIQAAAWNTITLCSAISDELPGKLAPYWFELILKAKGAEFLAALCLSLPYRLWTSLEKTLITVGKQDTLVTKVINHLSANKASADMLYWLWKSKLKEEKDKYLSNSTLIFKTLQQETKGNFLKSQRDLKKLLLDNRDFQEQVMLYGDQKCVLEFIRCVKHLPLLDAGEIQSVLIKIHTIYPQFTKDIEEKHQGPLKISLSKITSPRGYKKRRDELDHLINVEIPENAEKIKEAAAHGDFRENAEFKIAKEDKIVLTRRQQEWQQSLNGVQITDFTNVKVSNIVIPGCSVVVRFRDMHAETYHILGLLDSEPDKNMIPYDAPLGRILIGNEVGTRITLPAGDRGTIEQILPLSAELLKYIKG